MSKDEKSILKYFFKNHSENSGNIIISDDDQAFKEKASHTVYSINQQGSDLCFLKSGFAEKSGEDFIIIMNPTMTITGELLLCKIRE